MRFAAVPRICRNMTAKSSPPEGKKEIRGLEKMNKREMLAGLAGLPIAAAATSAQARLRCSQPAPNGLQQCEAGISSQVANVSISQRQNMNQWCWAACIQMVFLYYGRPISQQRIVSETFGNIVNWPAQSRVILSALNRSWTDDRGGRFTAQGDSYSANPISAAQDLAADRPLIIGTQGHAMVLTSLVYVRNANGGGEVTQAIVRDPWPGRGRRVLSAQEWYGVSFLARIRVS